LLQRKNKNDFLITIGKTAMFKTEQSRLEEARAKNYHWERWGGMSQTLSKVASFLKLRGKTIVTVLALLVIAVAIPYAIVDTIEKGRVYLFSSQFLEELPQRFSGSGRFRFILQPLLAILLGVRGGMADAKAGNPPYLFGLLFAAGQRRELLRSAGEAIGILLAMGIILDVVFQLVLYREVHPGAALLIGPILICTPYALSRALTNRLARGLGKK
jgi:hypothetical protein